MAHDKGSFDYKAINKNIRRILDARSELNNTAQVAMPFIKATTTLDLSKIHMGDGNIGFTLGLHAFNEDVKYEDIYSSVDGDMPLVGYTYTEQGTNTRVYASNNTVTNSRIFDLKANTFSTNEFIRIPPPGITKVTIGLNKNGLLAQGQLEISVPSLSQLETLHKTFLVPGVGMVLEWGQQFAPELSPSIGERANVADYLFPWHDRTKLKQLLAKLSMNQIGLEEILNDYAYKAEGQYMWMFGRVANFSVNSNSDGSFKCTVKIVGPSEDAWAYSTKNTVTPAKDPSAKYFCSRDTNSVFSYFSDTTTGGKNFKTTLDNTMNNPGPWKNHVEFFRHGNKKAGEPTETEQNPNINQNSDGFTEDAYFVTWRFFVNVIINKDIKSIFSSVLQSSELEKLGILLPYATDNTRSTTENGNIAYIDDPMESFVGMNKFLRSVNPGTMIIVNEEAAKAAASNPQYKPPGAGEIFTAPNDQTKLFYNGPANGGKALFEQSISGVKEVADKTDRGLLSAGVWLNHKAIVESMLSGNTILRGITNLLERMNAATLNYWQLTLDVAHPITGSGHPYSYMVVDSNFRDSSDRAVSKFINDVHVFNKYVRVNELGQLVGSELIDCSVDLSLPKLMFSQIATLGLVQPADMQNVANAGKTSAEITEEVAAAKLPQKPEDVDYGKSPKISSPYDAMREMFAITSLMGRDKNDNYSEFEQGPDLTVLPKTERIAMLKANGICGAANTQTPAQTGGNSNKANGIVSGETTIDKNTDLIAVQKLAKGYLANNNDICNKCIPSTNNSQYGKKDFRPAGDRPPKTIDEVIADINKFNQKISGLPKPQSNEFQITENSLLATRVQGATPDSGGHMAKSAHTTNQAIDIPVHLQSNADAVVEFWNEAGGYEVIDEYRTGGLNHIHLEWNAVVIPPAPVGPTKEAAEAAANRPTDAQCNECAKQQSLLNQSSAKLTEINKITEDKKREFFGLQNLFRYIEVFPEYMVAAMADTANGADANAFGASPGALSISADLTMPGVSGLRVGELFWIDRIPTFYKAFGAFQIISIEDNIGTDGWTTKIHARFNYLGKKWRESIAKSEFGNIPAVTQAAP